MTLSKKFILWTLLLLTVLLSLGGVSLWHLAALSRATHASAAEYDAADRADAAIVQVVWLRDALRGPAAPTLRNPQSLLPFEPDIHEAAHYLTLAAQIEDVGDAPRETQLAAALTTTFATARQQAALPSPATPADLANTLDQLHQSLQTATKLAPAAARRHITAAAASARQRLTWTTLWLALALAISLAIHYRQYLLLVRPLLLLRDQMRRSAARDFKEPIHATGDREFRDVASLFNGLARDLAELYRGMEQKILDRSRELVRSERLASVGFLAAGVAHEINNPLSVISGYAELAAKSLRRVLTGESSSGGVTPDSDPTDEATAAAEAEALASALDAQQIIRDEAFRCKEITTRLLSLARGGNDSRQPLALDEVARQVTTLTKGLKNYRDRRVTLDFQPTTPLEVVANPTEMKQVLLNLTVNALEAIPPDHGEVRIGGRRSGDWVELFVEDNGKGMAADTLKNIFEPFFTAKRGAGEPGTGLGLSITHAIIENHGGRIRAESPGPGRGRGSRFTLHLPSRGVVSSADHVPLPA